MHRRTHSTAWLLILILAAPGSALAQAEAAPSSSGEAEAAPAPASALPTGQAEPAKVPIPVPAPTAPVPAASAPTVVPGPLAHERGLVVLPYIGLNVPVGPMAERYSTGARLGVLAGWHIRPRISLDGEATFDFLDADADSSFVRPHEYCLDVTFSPLLHLRSGAIVIGPKLGWFTNRRWQSSDPGGGTRYVPNLAAHHGQGFVVGLNLGGFAAVGKLTLGMLATVAVRQFVTTTCDDHVCGSLLDPIMLGFSVAALF